MRIFISGLMLLFASFYCVAQCDIVQGPFKIDSESSVFIKKENDVDYPLAIYYKIDNKSHKVESYETNGSEPHVETVFFVNLKNKKNVIVLLSWQQKHLAEGINGITYQVFGYIYDSGMLTTNPLIRNDKELSGLEGEFGNESLNFKYKNAAKIKEYLISNYK